MMRQPVHRGAIAFKRRVAAAILETALLLPMLLLIILGTLDLFLMAFYQNILSVAAADLARQVSISGADQPTALQTWGPAGIESQWSGVTDGSSFPVHLVCMKPNDITVHLNWPDGTNQSGSRAVVLVSYQHRSVLGEFAPWHGTQLVANCEFLVVN